MVKKSRKTGTPVSSRKKGSSRSRSTSRKQGLIILPALKASETKKSPAKSVSNAKTAKKTVSSVISKSNKTRNLAAASNPNSQSSTKSIPQKRASDQTADYLPEYRSQTNGLRELLSSIDPQDGAFYSRDIISPEKNPIESSMHIPHSRPGIPGSPDLPIGPTRWGLYFLTTIGTIAFLFVSALAYSHITSPTGIDWAKLQTKTSAAYEWIAANLKTKPVAENADAHSTYRVLPDPLADFPEIKGTSIATTSRISTTAASPKRGTIKTPSAAEIFISPEELERQIRALEAASIAKSASIRRKTPKKKILSASTKSTSTNSSEFDRLIIIPAANIDPDMENQIFRRASSYLKQRDISSARMILQYAATLGSGISAMALAETFDPNYLEKVNLSDVSGSRSDARKWYFMAARLGIKEADARLTALK